jgi:uncharacterized membrane protein
VILFGILHCIAVASAVGLLFLRVSAVLTMAIAAIAFALPWLAQSTAFDARWLVWSGLGLNRPVMADYVPLLPWIAPFLVGLAFAKLADAAGLIARLRESTWRLPALLTWPGRHSLVIYLVHQPVLIGAFSAFRYFQQA